MKSKITPKLMTKAGKLAKNGFTVSQIAKSLLVSRSALYSNQDIMDTIKEAQSELRESIANDILLSSKSGEVASQIFICKRLNLFSNEYSPIR